GKLIIGGDGYLMTKCQDLKERSRYKDFIDLLGSVDKETARDLFLNADIFTQHNLKGDRSNQEECLGVSILEAMSYALPVVSCFSGAVIETVENNVTGLLVNSGDIHAQARGFLQLAGDP